MLYTPAPTAFLFQKVSAFSFDVMFSLFNGDICVRYSATANLPDINAYEVCIGMCLHLHKVFSEQNELIALNKLLSCLTFHI